MNPALPASPKARGDNEPSEAWCDAPPAPGSTDLARNVRDAFAEQGPIARAHADYRTRDAQTDMAGAVAQAIGARESLVVEAGTGVGKTYAYLVPVLLSGKRALVSTATKSLQDQLFFRDLPRVRDALALPVHAALLKGRENYLCLHRLKQARVDAGRDVSARMIARIERWAQATATGDLAEVEGLEERSPLRSHVTSTRDNCLGSSCPDFQACHVVKARREAMAADVVVVNHHLFFADVKLRDTGVAELLPTVDVAVFDEAHQLVDIGVQFLGLQLSTAQVVDLARDILAAGLTHARGLEDWAAAAQAVEHAARELRLEFGPNAVSRLRWPNDDAARSLGERLVALAQACEAASVPLASCSELDPAFDTLRRRSSEQAERARHFEQAQPDERVRWIEATSHHLRLVETPLDIADDLSVLRARGDRTWIFTSATLGDDDALTWFTAPSGLQTARVLRLGSPYDHAALARLWMCADAPRPDDPAHPAYVGRVAADCARRLGGRTMVLTTTLRVLPRIAQTLRDALRGEPIEVLTQGEQPRRVLLQRLRDEPGTVLVASASFWEGVDVPGDALQCVVIDKLPFPPPNDPLIEARAARIEREGGSAFNACFLAEAAVALKQGAGRLIRGETDRGLLVVCDPRMAKVAYGRRLRNALPPMTPVGSAGEAMAWLDEIAAPAARSPA